jgi:hypothetical protein
MQNVAGLLAATELRKKLANHNLLMTWDRTLCEACGNSLYPRSTTSALSIQVTNQK